MDTALRQQLAHLLPNNPTPSTQSGTVLPSSSMMEYRPMYAAVGVFTLIVIIVIFYAAYSGSATGTLQGMNDPKQVAPPR